MLRSGNERALLAAAAASLEGVEVIEQASPEGDHAANGLAEVGVREVKAQTGVLKIHLKQRLMGQLDWVEALATWLVRHSANCLSRYRIQADGKTPYPRRTGKRWRRQAVKFGEKAAFLPVAARREGRVAGVAGIFVGHQERTRALLFPSERGLLKGTRVHRGPAIVVPFRTWIAERFESSAEDRRPTVGQRIHPKVPRNSVDAHWRRA